MYNVGWSHGKEKMGDKPDYAKGSFYANPKYDVAASDEEIKAAPFFYPKNVRQRTTRYICAHESACIGSVCVYMYVRECM